MEELRGVLARTFDATERDIRTSEDRTPLVIEPLRGEGLGYLQDFVAENSSRIMAAVADHGAVLFRGFGCGSVADFEKTVLRIQGLQGIHSVFMAEAGRTLVPGTRYVFHTNSLYPTGGGLGLGDVPHSENYYTTDVPRFVCFLCLEPSLRGGQTGLVNSVGLYDDLPETTRRILEQKAFVVVDWSLSSIARRYGVSPERCEEFCTSAGLSIVVRGGEKFARMCKPSIVEHPITKERALVFNTEALVSLGIERFQGRAFLSAYPGWRWFAHRIVLRSPWVRSIPKIVRNVVSPSYWAARSQDADQPVGVASAFAREDVEALGRSVRKRFSSFEWRRGDILIIDNLKIAHCGMPGVGPRRLAVMLCSRIPMLYSADGPGCHVPANDDPVESLGALMERLRDGSSAPTTGAA